MNDKLAHLAGGPQFERNQEATVYVGNLDTKVNEDLAWELFLQCGPIVNVHLPRDKVTNEHQGYGFVEFKAEEDADYSIKIMHMVKLYGKPIKVNKASQDKRTQEVGANIFVGNLHEDVDEKMLRDVFSSFGIVLSTKVMRDPETGVSKRYGFVSYDNFESSDASISAMNGQYLCGKPIDVSYAYKKDTTEEKHGSTAERVLAFNRPNAFSGTAQQQSSAQVTPQDYKNTSMSGVASQKIPPPQTQQNGYHPMDRPSQYVSSGYGTRMPPPGMPPVPPPTSYPPFPVGQGYNAPPLNMPPPPRMPPPPPPR